MTTSIEILLATFRAGRFLEPLVESLVSQREVDARILARDDGSDDGTAETLAALARLHPGRIKIVEDGQRGLGATGNFSALLAASTAPYVALADQDDIWHPGKLAAGLAAVRAAEGTDPVPVLAHGDLRVVDVELRPIAASFAELQHLDLHRGSAFNRLLMQNVVTGCTVVANRALVQRCLPVPAQAVMHDYWMALAAAAFGRCVVIDGPPLIDYRQHSSNTVGAKRFSAAAVLLHPSRWRSDTLHRALAATVRQATAFSELHRGQLPPARREELDAFLAVFDAGFFGRRWGVIRNGFWKHGLLRNLGLLARI